jgi:hypothetical protein
MSANTGCSALQVRSGSLVSAVLLMWIRIRRLTAFALPKAGVQYTKQVGNSASRSLSVANVVPIMFEGSYLLSQILLWDTTGALSGLDDESGDIGNFEQQPQRWSRISFALQKKRCRLSHLLSDCRQ